MRARLLLLPLLVAVSACSDEALSTAPNAGLPSFVIADAARDFKSGFYWLPPMVRQPTVSGTFDASLSPTVEICELVDGACGSVLATYTMTSGPGEEFLRVQDDQHYHVNWHTDQFVLSAANRYRISVRAGVNAILLGYADVQPAANGSAFMNLDSNELVGLVEGRTLPIRFRVETGIVGGIDVEPRELTLEPGGMEQYLAAVSDLHGDAMTPEVIWSTSDESVATVDQAGRVTAVAEGTAVITASADFVTGSATLIVEKPVEHSVVLASAGDSHSCAMNEAGMAFCWGLGNWGQLGNGFLVNRFTPFAVAGGHAFTTVAAAETHSCGITTAGQAYCWGLNNVGQLGDNTATNRASPTLVAGDQRFTSIVAGTFHTCALAPSGEAYCWGFSTSGALGTGTTSARTPTPVLGGYTFASLTAGRSHTCGLTAAGEAFCWGLNSFGQLGDGTVSNRLVPSRVIGGATFVSISGGDAHTCALTAGGSAHCWGNADQGRLGMGDPGTSFHTSPQSVGGGLTFAMITAGEAHSCGIIASGEAYCWGSNAGGRLGVGTTDPQSLVPAAVAGGLLFRSIDVGDHSCGVTTTREVYCWGSGGTGQLGNGTTLNQPAPTPVAPFPES